MSKKNDLTEQLAIVQKQADEYLAGWQLSQANFANYKKTEPERHNEIVKQVQEEIMLNLIERLDQLKIAADHVPKAVLENNADWWTGMKYIMTEFEKFMKKYGVEAIDLSGPFDPNVHEAVSGSDEEGTVLEEQQTGYTLNGKVLRPAKVLIKK